VEERPVSVREEEEVKALPLRKNALLLPSFISVERASERQCYFHATMLKRGDIPSSSTRKYMEEAGEERRQCVSSCNRHVSMLQVKSSVIVSFSHNHVGGRVGRLKPWKEGL